VEGADIQIDFSVNVRRGYILRQRDWEALTIAEEAHTYMSFDELVSAIGLLGEADYVRLDKAARIYSGATEYAAEDLRQEAIVRSLDGTRRCPREVSPVVFLIGAMRSIASAGRVHTSKSQVVASLDVLGSERPVIQVASGVRNAEDNWIAKEDAAKRLAAIESLFRDDEDCLMVIMGDLDEMSAPAIRDMQGWSNKEYDTVRRRIRRKIEGAFPNGFSI
jgi:DNA-directed RNA polymerase specialized sigma24 family protein